MIENVEFIGGDTNIFWSDCMLYQTGISMKTLTLFSFTNTYDSSKNAMFDTAFIYPPL